MFLVFFSTIYFQFQLQDQYFDAEILILWLCDVVDKRLSYEDDFNTTSHASISEDLQVSKYHACWLLFSFSVVRQFAAIAVCD